MVKAVLLITTFFITSFSFSQQRIGVEVSSRLEDLSIGLQFQKVVKRNFLIGAGFLINGRYWGGGVNNIETNDFPFSEIEPKIVSEGTEYQIYGYSSSSGKAFSAVFMTGYFHEFSIIHGLRANFNLRCGLVQNDVYMLYEQIGNTNDRLADSKSIWHTYQALSPEIYHTIRWTEKWTIYYGVRLPVFLNFGKDYHPKFKEDIYKRSLPEVAIGVSFSLNKPEDEQEDE